MEKTDAQKLAGVLKILVTITFTCNLLTLILVPGLSLMRGPEDVMYVLSEGIAHVQIEGVFQVLLWIIGRFVAAWFQVWWNGAYAAVLAVFLLFCGGCTAVLLWQARRVLDTILKGDTFTFGNAANMRRTAVCCLFVSAAALLRTVWGLFYYASPSPLLTYNALFCPIFLMAGLLCLVMSALFRQAAELKTENDLTI